MTLAFVPGVLPSAPRLLDRFLPPLAEGVAAHYVSAYSQPGDLIFDPYGTAPAVAVEALRLGRRVVVATLNPVVRLALSLAVRPPSVAELRLALTRLGDAPTGRGPGDRLERHVASLYESRCGVCDTAVVADYFDWDTEIGEPVEKGYVCAKCGPTAAPTDEADRFAARRHGRTGPDYHFLLGRVAGPGDEDRGHVREALEVYPARTLAAIGAVLVKLEGLDVSRETHRLLAGLLIAAFDAATVLTQDRPKVLVTPRRYREVNFWLALEQAVGLLAGAPAPDRSMPLEALLAEGSEPGIHALAGSVREASAHLPVGSCRLIVTALPRPNQALWTLSAVWAAWLWGEEAAEPIRQVLRRRRYDWAWHARALQRTLAAAGPALAAEGRLVGLLAEAEPGFCGAALAAGHAAGMTLEGAALRADSGEAQLVWRVGAPTAEAEPGIWVRRAATDVAPAAAANMTAALRARGEPSPWTCLHFAGWVAMAQQADIAAEGDDLLGPTNRLIEAAARDATLFRRLGADAETDLSTGLWWLADEPALGAVAPLADRVETLVRDALWSAGLVHEHDFLPGLYAALPGPETPGRSIVTACLASYAEQLEAGQWRLRPDDAPGKRAAEQTWMEAALRALGERLGFGVRGNNPLIWQDEAGVMYAFAVLGTAELGAVLLGPNLEAERLKYLVVPGGRAGLAEAKFKRDPRLRASLTAGRWAIVKYRLIRRVAADAALTRETLERALAGDPLEAAQQLALSEQFAD